MKSRRGSAAVQQVQLAWAGGNRNITTQECTRSLKVSGAGQPQPACTCINKERSPGLPAGSTRLPSSAPPSYQKHRCTTITRAFTATRLIYQTLNKQMTGAGSPITERPFYTHRTGACDGRLTRHPGQNGMSPIGAVAVARSSRARCSFPRHRATASESR
jgi:hypothetical protein